MPLSFPRPVTVNSGWARAVAVVALLSLTHLAVGTGPATATTPPATPSCGAVILSGGAWLGGRGVDVHYNTHVPGSTGSCAGTSVTNPAVQYGGGWQCIELAARLYYVLGWGTVYAGKDGGAQYIPEGSPGLQFHPNGSGYVPVPGDVVVEWGGTWGHASVVESVSATAITAVEQNVGVTAWHVYPFSNGVAGGAYSAKGVRGFMHSSLNGATNRPTPVTTKHPAPPSAPAIASVIRRHLAVSLTWSRPASVSPITGTHVWVRTYSPAGVLDGGRVVPIAAAAKRARINGLVAGARYRFNVRAVSAGGVGNWSNGRNARPRP